MFWIDSDAIIMDESTKLEEFIDESNINGWWENDKCIHNIGAFNAIYHMHNFKKVEYKKGDFVLHFAGMSAEGRVEKLKELRPDIF
ncbi:hypothetical protein CMI37_05410 [Candidatus Pacearchaeota archaeon]|nr:hypothetical protein [Candidatus Pacearchaeota archaeon]